MPLVADINRAWTDGGAITLLTRSLKKAIRPACKVGTLVFMERDLLEPMPVRRDVQGIVIREATMEDIYLFSDRNLFAQRINEGNRCFMGIEESTGKLTNCRWVNTSAAHIPEVRRYLILKSDEAYVYDLKTFPEFRRRGIDAYTRHYVYSYLRDAGYTKLYAYIHGDNNPSLSASRTLLKPVARVRYVQPIGCEPIIISGRSGLAERLTPFRKVPSFPPGHDR